MLLLIWTISANVKLMYFAVIHIALICVHSFHHILLPYKHFASY